MDGDFCIAAGLPWMGREVKQGAVVWVAAERAEEARHRLLALSRHYKRDDVPLWLIPKTLNLFDPKADLRPLIEAIREIEARHGVKVEKVTLDTLARVMVGGDENSTKDMNALVANLDRLREAVRAHVSVIHHTSIGEERMRGAYALKGAIDTQIEIKKNRTIYIEKQSGWADHYALARFKLKVVQLGPHPRSGKPVTSCVIEPTVIVSDGTDDSDRLLAGIRAKLSKEGMAEDAEITAGFIVEAAKEAGIEGTTPQQTPNGYRVQIYGLLKSLLPFDAIRKLAKQGTYQLVTTG
jgi:hypothetical protein